MKTLLEKTVHFLRSEEGPTATEYAFMLALIIIVCIAAISLLGNKVSSTFTGLNNGLPTGSE